MSLTREQRLTRVLAEALAMQLASFPIETLPESGLSETLCAAMRAAHTAFHTRVTEAEIDVLQRETFDDVREGLRELQWYTTMHDELKVPSGQ